MVACEWDNPNHFGVQRMRINVNTRQYEGIPAASALGMAVMESSGIRQLIDDACEWDHDQRKLSPGMAVKAMIGPMFNGQKRWPLYKIDLFYQLAPIDLLFGDEVTHPGLNDVSLARGLDTVFDAGVERLFWDCAQTICKRFGIDNSVLHMDSTNFSVYAMEPDDKGDGAAVPRHSGHAKDRHNELLQYTMQTVTNTERVLMFLKPYSGNTSDGNMDLDTLMSLKDRMDVSRTTIVADNKLVNAKIVREMRAMDVGFVSKVPTNFCDKVRDKVLYSSGQGVMDACPDLEGWSVYDTDSKVEGKDLRFIACRNERAVRKKRRHIETKDREKVQKALDTLARKEFSCQADAKKAFDATIEKYRRNTPYSAIAEYVPFETYDRGNKRGHPKKGEEPKRRTEWKVKATLTVDTKRLEEMCEAGGTNVLVTNLPRRDTDADNVRDGACAQTVLRLYLNEYKVEHTYRLMKSGFGVDRVFFRTPSRENAMMFVVGIATLIENIIDAMNRRNGERDTFRTVVDQFTGTTVRYSRSEDSMDFEGSPERVEQLFRYLETLRIEPQLLLEHA